MFFSKVIPLAAVFVSGAWAQFDMAKCASGNDWNKNSLGQDPCTVGSLLDASCRGLAEYTYPPLNSTQYYLPPRANHTGDLTCDCNTVMYSFYMACAACQGGQIYSWSQYIPQCQDVYITQFPTDIAQGTAVPRWAYYNVTSLPNQLWNATVAMSIGRDPEEKPKPVNTVGTGGSSTSGPKNTITKTSSGLPGPTESTDPKGGTNVGAIVGGVVGSVVLLTILGVAVFLYMRSRGQRAQQPQPQYMPNPDEGVYKQRPISYGAPPMTNVPFTPYNPSDPSTFPPQSPPSSVAYTTPPNGARGTYSGMPEV